MDLRGVMARVEELADDVRRAQNEVFTARERADLADRICEDMKDNLAALEKELRALDAEVE